MAVAVGHRFPPTSFFLDPTRIEEYVLALGVAPERDWTPVAGAAVPPGFLMYVTTYGAEPVHQAFDLPWQLALYGGSRYSYQAPLRIGDTIGVAPVVTGCKVAGPENAPLTFWELRIDYTDPGGRLAVVEHSTTIARSAGPSS